VLNEWISRPGLPMLIARVIGNRLTIDQRRFFNTGQHTVESWPVPVVARIDGVERRMLLEEPHTEIELTTSAPPFLNVDASGFYRVLYDLHTLEQLRHEFPKLSPLDQWSVVHDLAPFVEAGDLDLGQYLAYLRLGESVTSFAVVSQFGRSGLNLYLQLYDHPDFLEGYRNFLRAQTQRLGLEALPGEPPTNGVLRESLLSQRVWVDPDLARQLAARYDEYDRIAPELREAIATAYVRTGGAAAFETLLRRFRSAPSEGEKFRLLGALTAAPDPTWVERILRMADQKELLLSLVPTAVVGASRNVEARALAWTWLQRQVDSFAENFQGTGRTSELLEVVLPRLGLGREAEVRDFFRNRPVREGSRGIAKGLELLAAGVALRRRLGLDGRGRQA
ncbi:MAG TPA: ERAP1-like C-terminal domain-containing protein, partial [Thermoplasmata archaeon]|nr:ERAP1-like C-terminal domain-containing protein [Thermoplasmata archaeon]